MFLFVWRYKLIFEKVNKMMINIERYFQQAADMKIKKLFFVGGCFYEKLFQITNIKDIGTF